MDLPLLPTGAPSGWYADPSYKKKARYWDGVAWTDNARDDVPVRPTPTAQDLANQRTRPALTHEEANRWRAIVITTSHELPNAQIVKHVHEVFGVTVRTRDTLSNAFARIRAVVGGEVGTYTELMTEARDEAIDRLRQQAHQLGANAVVSMRLDANQISDLMTEFIAYGSAVVVAFDEQPSS